MFYKIYLFELKPAIKKYNRCKLIVENNFFNSERWVGSDRRKEGRISSNRDKDRGNRSNRGKEGREKRGSRHWFRWSKYRECSFKNSSRI